MSKKKKKTFIDELYRQIKKAHPSDEVDKDGFSDKSSQWVVLTRGNMRIEFDFDKSGDVLQEIIVSKDIVQVVDEEIIFRSKP